MKLSIAKTDATSFDKAVASVFAFRKRELFSLSLTFVMTKRFNLLPPTYV